MYSLAIVCIRAILYQDHSLCSCDINLIAFVSLTATLPYKFIYHFQKIFSTRVDISRP
jgi:hypothetical protein